MRACYNPLEQSEAPLPIIPYGTRYVLPPEWEWREHLKHQIQSTLSSWGYAAVQTPALELFDPQHPQSELAFHLTDRDGTLLSLRSEYTAPVGRMLRADLLGHQYPLRVSYAGNVWLRGLESELGRLREFTQVGAELVGVSSAQADAELLELARDALESVGVRFRLEIADRSFLAALLSTSGLGHAELEHLSDIIERKATPELREALERYKVTSGLKADLLELPDLYGGIETLERARKIARTSEALESLEKLEQTVKLTGRDDFLFDLGMARRISYYTGFTFRAYTPDFGQPLLGGGRYDTGIPGAGFAIGLERVMSALGTPPALPRVQVLALDFASARFARAQGYRTELLHGSSVDEARLEAQARGPEFIAHGGVLERVNP